MKRIIQENDDIGKIAGPVPFIISKGLELFLKEIDKISIEAAGKVESKRLLPCHL